jgi:hypothetical protein
MKPCRSEFISHVCICHDSYHCCITVKRKNRLLLLKTNVNILFFYAIALLFIAVGPAANKFLITSEYNIYGRS